MARYNNFFDVKGSPASKGDEDIPYFMTPTDDETPTPHADGNMLEAISAQLNRLSERVCDDIAKHRKSPDSGGFLLYYLTDRNGEPLKSTQMTGIGATKVDIETSAGFSNLLKQCESQSAALRIDEHFYSDDPHPTTIFRVIVDGWDE